MYMTDGTEIFSDSETNLKLILDGDKKPEMPPGSFYKPQFFDFMKEEFSACREGVGIIDMSSFSKIEIRVIIVE